MSNEAPTLHGWGMASVPKTDHSGLVVTPDIMDETIVHAGIFWVRGEWCAAEKGGVVLGDPVACTVGDGWWG